MKQNSEQLSALIDNELINEQLLDDLICSETEQLQFSRYHLIGDVMRGEFAEQPLDIDISQQVMNKISASTLVELTAPAKTGASETNNVVSFVKRFGQYAIAASVAGVVVLTSLITANPTIENSNPSLEVLNTVPFGGTAAPVSLQASKHQSQQALKERHERLEALLKDHQLQLQTQP